MMKNWFVLCTIPIVLFIFGGPDASGGKNLAGVRAESSQAVGAINVLIVGPESVPIGRLVKLDASGSDAEAFAWTMAGSSGDDYDVTPDGKIVYFATSSPGKYVFTLALARNGADKAPPSIALAQHTVTVQGSAPTPPQPPMPLPDPLSPTLPQGRFGLAQWALEQAKGVSDKSLVPAFTANFATVASMAAAGVIKDVPALTKLTAEKNSATAGANKQQWSDALFSPLGKKLAELNKAGTLKTIEDHQTAWSEIAMGLNAVK